MICWIPSKIRTMPPAKRPQSPLRSWRTEDAGCADRRLWRRVLVRADARRLGVAKIGGAKALEALIALFNDPIMEVRNEAVAAVVSLGRVTWIVC